MSSCTQALVGWRWVFTSRVLSLRPLSSGTDGHVTPFERMGPAVILLSPTGISMKVMSGPLIGRGWAKTSISSRVALRVSHSLWAENTRRMTTVATCFPQPFNIIRRLRPRAFIVENVKGLTRSSFANYYQYILLQLTFPEVGKREDEEWLSHFRRLQEEKASGKAIGNGLTYNVVPTLVNAADYGIPQKRERVFIIGFRSDLGVEWSFPKATHSFDALLYDQFVSGEYWMRHDIKKPAISEKHAARIRRLRMLPPETLPWRTVRDALIGLPGPKSNAAKTIPDHRFQDGAKVYPGHTGSPLDLPAKTLKAGDHGVPGGENMLVYEDGSVRYFTVREAARIQTFPDGYRFHGSWTETMRQLGNAVPVMLGRVVAASVAERLVLAQMRQLAQSTTTFKGAA